MNKDLNRWIISQLKRKTKTSGHWNVTKFAQLFGIWCKPSPTWLKLPVTWSCSGERRQQPTHEGGGAHRSHRWRPQGRRQEQRRLHWLRRVCQVAAVRHRGGGGGGIRTWREEVQARGQHETALLVSLYLPDAAGQWWFTIPTSCKPVHIPQSTENEGSTPVHLLHSVFIPDVHLPKSNVLHLSRHETEDEWLLIKAHRKWDVCCHWALTDAPITESSSCWGLQTQTGFTWLCSTCAGVLVALMLHTQWFVCPFSAAAQSHWNEMKCPLDEGSTWLVRWFPAALCHQRQRNSLLFSQSMNCLDLNWVDFVSTNKKSLRSKLEEAYFCFRIIIIIMMNMELL